MARFEDHKCILKGNPWIFRNSWLIIQEWDGISTIGSLEFSKAPIWVQTWGLHIHCKTVQMGLKLGVKLGDVLEYGVFKMLDMSFIVKVKIGMSIKSPIIPKMYIGSKNNGVR